MGICRDSRHKRRATGGKRAMDKKKRKYEMGRQPAMTKLGTKQVTEVRCMGGNKKFRALRLDAGNFSWGTEVTTRKARIVDVLYNASNNELVRTKTLVKGCVVTVDAAPFRQWYEQHYGVRIGIKKGQAAPEEDVKRSDHAQRKLRKRSKGRSLEPALDDLFGRGRLMAVISSRPGQCGRADGYILEGPELAFYKKQLAKKK
uniref:40S ribosomal protein S8 n=1 Tax=Phaeomonas parva TaxID=124430 RepID=A0A7S1U0C2_9STRA|eukprot:CAMPEP_0118867562 /NCGR_PEP_ID=MMETSP1163-20130328/11124_1 /TAXON_ID=124430 /ORGANISM="Phaeomonas parva, Strain CCMP2877" /LENGTH=201 /DNA_ID=CAMNT_0006801985 /DNA_START=44 /DNA_END=649 /DNA_ORIENTATION=-